MQTCWTRRFIIDLFKYSHVNNVLYNLINASEEISLQQILGPTDIYTQWQ